MSVEPARDSQKKSDGFARYLQTAANVAVIGLCLLVAWLATTRGLGTAAPVSSAPALSYRVGDSIDAVDGVDFRAASATLVFVVREDCRFCNESLPFYRRLSAARDRAATQMPRLIVLSTDADEALSAYLQTQNIHVDQVKTIQPGALKVPGTPALLLVTSDGTIRNFWRGRLNEAQEKDVFKALGLVSP